jgi:hypothetical protein
MRGRNRNNKGPNPLTRSYESNGPDVKIRGTAQHIAEKYSQLARDAQSSGDPVAAENYLQHAEHYFRIIAAAQEQLREQYGYQRSFDEDGEEEGGFAPGERGYANGEDGDFGQQPQPFEARPFENRQDNRGDNRGDGRGDDERGDRQDRGERPQRFDRGDRADRGDRPNRFNRDRQDRGQDNRQDNRPDRGPRQDYRQDNRQETGRTAATVPISGPSVRTVRIAASGPITVRTTAARAGRSSSARIAATTARSGPTVPSALRARIGPSATAATSVASVARSRPPRRRVFPPS